MIPEEKLAEAVKERFDDLLAELIPPVEVADIVRKEVGALIVAKLRAHA